MLINPCTSVVPDKNEYRCSRFGRISINRPDGALWQRKDESPERPGAEGATEKRVRWRLRRRQAYVQVVQAADGVRISGAYVRSKYSGTGASYRRRRGAQQAPSS